MIEVSNLTKLHGELVAVDDLSFTVQPGEVMGLVGPNGAGKTTTIRCVVGILRPSQGTIRICGHDLASDTLAAKRALAFIPDEPRLFDYLTVEEHLQFTARIYGVEDAPALAAGLLDELQLRDKRQSLPGELSRGMKQKLAIACGLLHKPGALLLDEPLTGLDPLGIRRMKRTIVDRARQGASVIVSSHLLHLVEEIADRVLIIQNGRKVAHGTQAEIRALVPELSGAADLEDIFIHVTGADEAPPPAEGGAPR